MVVVGLGTDIVEIARMEKIIIRMQNTFAKRVLTVLELHKYASSKFPARYLAKYFAVKEAAAKALGTGISCGVTFQDFEVINDELGKPMLVLHGMAEKLIIERGVTNVMLSISDEKCYAVATVLFQK
ncbi:holo-ACP synthase [Candidatus Enterovibrio escicola]|uniref:holo-ACP synthase n=1 Tax=Candidatus Enterovibrio escicola TaxID=1927127 RepID=UPI001238053E|nr:holo-ACP synthase [Candidatus Enterovibrio escacola]